MKVIFLDIDGVLNGHEVFENGYCGIRAANVAELNFLLKEVPDARIVLTSSWRYMMPRSMNLEGFTNLLLSHGVNCLMESTSAKKVSRLMASTVKDEDIPGRGLQISHWLKTHGANSFASRIRHVVLDDMKWDFDKYPKLNVVYTHPQRGLERPQTIQAIKYLC